MRLERQLKFAVQGVVAFHPVTFHELKHIISYSQVVGAIFFWYSLDTITASIPFHRFWDTRGAQCLWLKCRMYSYILDPSY
jgi:hypothetical protein